MDNNALVTQEYNNAIAAVSDANVRLNYLLNLIRQNPKNAELLEYTQHIETDLATINSAQLNIYTRCVAALAANMQQHLSEDIKVSTEGIVDEVDNCAQNVIDVVNQVADCNSALYDKLTAIEEAMKHVSPFADRTIQSICDAWWTHIRDTKYAGSKLTKNTLMVLLEIARKNKVF